MRMLSKVITGAAAAATVIAVVAGPALADPPTRVTPKATDVVGVGSNTTEYMLNQLTFNYNNSHKTGQHIYSFDALNDAAAATSKNIVEKKGCKATPRPNGSSAGISALATNIKTGSHFCVDFARSSRAFKTGDPGGLSFIPIALDNVSYASLAKGSNAPANLTTHQLQEIYSCSVRHWNQVGGKSTKLIHPLLPQAGSGTLSFFLAAIGVTLPGTCVTEPKTLEENEGTDPIFRGANRANEIIPFSVGRWVSQQFHSPACAIRNCPSDKSGVFIKCKKATKKQNQFGCNLNGSLKVNKINGFSPTVGSGAATVLNPHFSPTFIRTLFNVVRTSKGGIPAYLQKFIGKKGFFCSGKEKSVITNYGFEPTRACG